MKIEKGYTCDYCKLEGAKITEDNVGEKAVLIFVESMHGGYDICMECIPKRTEDIGYLLALIRYVCGFFTLDEFKQELFYIEEGL